MNNQQSVSPNSQNDVPVDSTKPEITSPLSNVVIRNQFYRDSYRTLVKIALIEAAAIVGLIVSFAIFMNVYTPKDRYFATTEDGRIIPMVALSERNLSDSAVISWATQAVTETMSFGFHDYQRRLQQSSRHFTPQGWRSFVKALVDSQTIETIQGNRQIITAAIRSAPTIVAQGLAPNGIYRWELEIPMTLTYELGQSRQTVNRNIHLVLVRTSRLESSNGVGIELWQEAAAN